MRRKRDLATRQQEMASRQAAGWKGRGRPPVKIDHERVKTLAEQLWSDSGIAAMLGISVATLRFHCAELLDRARSLISARLQLAMYRLAVGGHAGAITYLGKELERERLRSIIAGERELDPFEKFLFIRFPLKLSRTTDYAGMKRLIVFCCRSHVKKRLARQHPEIRLPQWNFPGFNQLQKVADEFRSQGSTRVEPQDCPST